MFHKLSEWLDVLPKTLTVSVEIRTYGQLLCLTGYQRLLTPMDKSDEENLNARVYLVKFSPWSDKIIFDTDAVRYFKDEKDGTITDLWEKLYKTETNETKLEELFNFLRALKINAMSDETLSKAFLKGI